MMIILIEFGTNKMMISAFHYIYFLLLIVFSLFRTYLIKNHPADCFIQ